MPLHYHCLYWWHCGDSWCTLLHCNAICISYITIDRMAQSLSFLMVCFPSPAFLCYLYMDICVLFGVLLSFTFFPYLLIHVLLACLLFAFVLHVVQVCCWSLCPSRVQWTFSRFKVYWLYLSFLLSMTFLILSFRFYYTSGVLPFLSTSSVRVILHSLVIFLSLFSLTFLPIPIIPLFLPVLPCRCPFIWPFCPSLHSHYYPHPHSYPS